MDKNDDTINFTPDDSSLSVDAILAEYEAERALFSEAAIESEMPREPEAAPGNRIVYDSREQAIGEADIVSDEALYEPVPIVEERPEPLFESMDEAPAFRQVAAQEAEDYGAAFDEPEPEPEPEEDFQLSIDAPLHPEYENATIDEMIAEAEVEANFSQEEYARAGEYDAGSGRKYTEAGDHDAGDDFEDRPERRPAAPPRPDFFEGFLAPLIGLIMAPAKRREEKRRAEHERRQAAPKKEIPELRADRAAAFYNAQAQSLKLRCIFASAVTLILIWLSLGLPAAGLLGGSPNIKALACLILELVVLVIGLDIFTTGMLTLSRKKPGAETLIAVSAIISAIDAAVIAVTGSTVVGLPFCGVSALSMVLALWGNYFSCRAFSLSFAAAALTDAPTAVLSLSGIDEEGAILAKAKIPLTGFVRNAESADIFESSYRLIAPILIIGSFILSLFTYIASEKCTSFIHTLAATMASGASLSAVFGFAFPFYTLAKRLAKSGVAIAGYFGAAELGRIKRVMVSDTDVFPARTLSIADISMAEGVRSDTVIAYTGSMIAASGMGIAPVFVELMRKNNCSMQRVEDFACHEGGGLVARVNGDLVYVGSSGFMKLMGIRMPKNAGANSAVYTAVNDSLSGIFAVNYKPAASVQRALVSLLRGHTDPLFAIRDFNITPVLLKQKFRLPLDNYNFPSFADRYRISSAVTEEQGSVSAMFSRGGLNSFAGVMLRGRKLYNRTRVSLALSLMGTIIGMVLMLALCWTGSYDSASCGNLLAYMLLWLVPTFVISLGLRN